MRWLALILLLSSCGLTSLLPTGGTNVAANTQIGKENNQGVITTNNRDTSIRPQLRPKNAEEVVQNNTVKNTEIDPFMLILLCLGWLLPSPAEMGRGLHRFVTSIWHRKN